ncbi:MAG: hypothetical protein KZY61_07445 [Clostridiaceae bacterium]|nr:hypothetical protein [Clostridiaceae bacterium]MBW4860565.1 hypothetical protein [Clostridiaceae bacterium]MBW4868481.1 hypothetical protein [Clostridiaceae bacterium]
MKNKNENENISVDQKLNNEQKKIAEWLENIRFRKQFFGGVSEQDVWKKIGKLNDMYEAALNAERIRYNIMIENYKKTCNDIRDREKAHDE